MRSFFPWIGGKSQLAKRITAVFPGDIQRYIEAFGGGGSVLFYKDRHAPFKVYNDADGQLVNLFCCVKYHRTELQREIAEYINSREIFEDICSTIGMRGLTDIQRAAMFYVQIKMSYGADRRSYGCTPKNLSADHLNRFSSAFEWVRA